MMKVSTIAAAALALSACHKVAEPSASNAAQPAVNAVANAPAPAIPPPETGPNARTSLAEPQGTIDPTSVEAAGQVVQHYGALIEQNRWGSAISLWNDKDSAAKAKAELSRYAMVHLEIGNPSEPEGAAGSIYVTVPVIFYGDAKDGRPFRRPADVILRRVNDVPGSTPEQRRWHIERVEWKAAG